jgi:hypothetical protein
MSTISTEAASAARSLPHEREHVEGSPEIFQDLARHLEALRGMCGHVTRPMLQKLMSIEISLTLAELRRFSIVRTDAQDRPGILANAERALAEVRAYAARRQYAEGLGYAERALGRVVESIGGAPMPPLFRSS